MLVIAERINSSRKYIRQAIKEKNVEFIQNEAQAQAQAGATYIDVNAGTFVGEEKDRLKWVVDVVQEVVETPLCIDSPDPEVIKAILPLAKKTPMINSINLEPDRLTQILPLVVEHGTKVIGLCQSEDEMAETADAKVRMAGVLVEKMVAAGGKVEDLYIDPLVYPVSTNTKSAMASIKAISRIMEEFPGVHTTCGLTNVSFGLPNRKLVNRSFLVAAICHGLDSAILDPTDKQLYGALRASMLLAGRDEYCMAYVSDFRQGLFE